MFKAKHHSKASYTSKVVGKNIQATDKAVKLPKLGWVKAKVSTQVQGRILNATVSMSRSGKFFVSLCCTEVDVPQLLSTGAAVGLDVGIKDLVITSDGQKYDNPSTCRRQRRSSPPSSGGCPENQRAAATGRRPASVWPGSMSTSPTAGRTTCISSPHSWSGTTISSAWRASMWAACSKITSWPRPLPTPRGVN
mgnify:CR=1 FL=1